MSVFLLVILKTCYSSWVFAFLCYWSPVAAYKAGVSLFAGPVSLLRANMEGLHCCPSPLKALRLAEVLEMMRAVFILHVWGELIHHPATSEGLAWTRELLSRCSWKAFRYGRAWVVGGNFIGKGGVRQAEKCLVHGSPGAWAWAGLSYSNPSMHQLKFGPCSDGVCWRGCEGLGVISVITKPPSGAAHSFQVISWATMATGVGMFCARLPNSNNVWYPVIAAASNSPVECENFETSGG